MWALTFPHFFLASGSRALLLWRTFPVEDALHRVRSGGDHVRGARVRDLHQPQEGLCSAPQGPPGLGAAIIGLPLEASLRGEGPIPLGAAASSMVGMKYFSEGQLFDGCMGI